MHSTPYALKAYDKAHALKRKLRDEEMWMQGKYNLEALMVALSHFGAGLAGKRSGAKYLEKPFMLKINEEASLKNRESKEEVAVFEMKQRVKLLERQGLPQSPM